MFQWMHLGNTGALEDLKDLGEPVPPRHVTLKTVHSDVYDQAAFLQKSKTPAGGWGEHITWSCCDAEKVSNSKTHRPLQAHRGSALCSLFAGLWLTGCRVIRVERIVQNRKRIFCSSYCCVRDERGSAFTRSEVEFKFKTLLAFCLRACATGLNDLASKISQYKSCSYEGKTSRKACWNCPFFFLYNEPWSVFEEKWKGFSNTVIVGVS